jgi:alpha-tubulin suppressor-like RCC1 family protein
MAYIECCIPSLPDSPLRGGRVRRLTRRLAPVLAPALMVAGLGCREDAESPTGPASGPALDIAPAQVLSFRQVSTGDSHTCGVTTDNRAFCWGRNDHGQLGNRTDTGPETCDGFLPCSTRPAAVAGGLRFRQVSAGGDHTCGVTTDNRAFCWGLNHKGQVGDGTFRSRLVPVPVDAGGLQFRRVSAGGSHTCGVTTDNRAFCWGRNGQGRLGDGTTTDIDRVRPVAVTGGLFFLQVSPGDDHTCGVTTTNRVYCWGSNSYGQLGEGGTVGLSPTPIPIASGRRFREVTAGNYFFAAYTCAVTTDDRAFCWGNGRAGQLGDGKNFLRDTPRAVAGGLHFRQVRAGAYHTCGVTTGNQAFCWGRGFEGALGDGTTTLRLTPVAVSGGLQFRQVDAGFFHSCAVTTGDLAYCWGNNTFGQLGDGTTTDHLTPVSVAGPM